MVGSMPPDAPPAKGGTRRRVKAALGRWGGDFQALADKSSNPAVFAASAIREESSFAGLSHVLEPSNGVLRTLCWLGWWIQ